MVNEMETEKQEAIEAYKQSVLKLYRFVSPIVSNADFHDAVNGVILARKRLYELKIELSEVSYGIQ